MIKATVLYGHPNNHEVFEIYYSETHLPIAAKTLGVVKFEDTRCLLNAIGKEAGYYHMACL